jgi:leader peptidase (prepilin peptidase) / N-methyltransferase
MADLGALFAAAPVWFHLSAAAVLGLLVGSFLNVVILRFPPRMAFGWRREAASILETDLKPEFELGVEPPSLVWEPSHCPNCSFKLQPWHNIPVISYVVLLGRCSCCKTPISPMYPLIEAFTAVLSVLVIWHFGATLQGFAALILTWTLIAASGIDARTQYLPDEFTLGLLWLGLIASLVPVFVSPTDAILGAVFGYLSLWSVYQLYKLVRGVEGMGFGDFKMLAALGAWVGWQKLLMIVLISALVGTIFALTRMLIGRHKQEQPMPFGPFLAAAGWVSLLYGEPIIRWYLRFSGVE